MLYDYTSQDSNGKRRAMSRYSPKRLLWLSLGLICVAVGAAGVFIPLLPTTSFMLLAAFAFARSSPRLHKWLTDHKMFGPLISNWNVYGAISRPAKAASMLSIMVVIMVSILLNLPLWILMIQIPVLGCVAFFLLTRPAPPEI